MTKCLAILDTSILFLIADNMLSLDTLLESLAECKVAIPYVVILELNKLADKIGEKSRKARWILTNLVPRFEILQHNVSSDKIMKVDDILLEVCKNYNAILVTADIELYHRAAKEGVNVACFRRSKKGLELRLKP